MRAWCCLRAVYWLATFWLCSSRLQVQADAYQDIIDDGIQEFSQHNYVEARALFEQAHALRPNARTLRALGFCAYELRHYAQAQSELEAALTDNRNPLTEQQIVDVRNALTKAKRYVGELQLATQPDDASVVLDGRSINERHFHLDVGDHLLVGSAPGFHTRDLTVTIMAGQLTTARLVLPGVEIDPAQAVKPEPQPSAPALEPASARLTDDQSPGLTGRWWFWTAIGLVVAGAAVATVLVVTNNQNEPAKGTTGITLHTP